MQSAGLRRSTERKWGKEEVFTRRLTTRTKHLFDCDFECLNNIGTHHIITFYMAAQPSPIMGLMQNPGSIPRPTRSVGSGTCAKSVTTAAGAAHGATHDDFKITSKTATNIDLMTSAVAASEDDGHQDGSSSLRREHDGLDAAVEPNDAITASERDDPALDVSFSSVQEEPDAGASPAREPSCSVHRFMYTTSNQLC